MFELPEPKIELFDPNLSLGTKCTQEVQALRFGIDTVRFNFLEGYRSNIFEKLFEGLSLNSPQNDKLVFMGYEMTGLFAQTRAKKILQLQFEGDIVICIEQIIEAGLITKMSYTVTFYAAYFYITDLKGLLDRFIQQYKNNMKVSRVDIALDVLTSVDSLWQTHKTKAQKKNIFRKGDEIETFYLGPKANNKRHFIRVYNKKLDSARKGKFHLFASYFLESLPVSRIEVQINSLSVITFNIKCSDISESVSMSGRIWEIFKECCMNTSGTDFGILPFQKTSKQISTAKDVSSFLNELPYAKRMLGYARRLQEYGFDPIEYLREHLTVPIEQSPSNESSTES